MAHLTIFDPSAEPELTHGVRFVRFDRLHALSVNRDAISFAVAGGNQP